MHRPKEHIMETQSDKIFANQVPDEWIYRKIDMDYGLDREIEIVVNGKLTGKTLLVQLKSSASVDSSEEYVAFALETDKLQYYMERDVPVLLVVVDLKDEKCYALFIQEYVYEKLDIIRPSWRQQKTAVLEIPAGNIWAHSIDKAKAIAFGGPFYIAIKKLSCFDTETTLRWKTNPNSVQVLEEFGKSLDRKASQIHLDLALRYSVEGENEQSLAKLLSVYKKPEADPKIRLKAIEGLVWYYNPTIREQNHELFELAKKGSDLADTIGDKIHSFYFRGILMQAVFFKVVNDLTNQRLLQKISRESKSEFEFLINASIQETSQKLALIGQDFVSNLLSVERERYYGAFADLLRRHALMMLYMYQSLVVWVERKQIDDLLKSAENDLKLASKLCEYMKWDDLGCMVLGDMAMLYHFRNDIDNRRSVLKQFQGSAKRTGHIGLIKQAEEKWESYEARGRFMTGPDDITQSRDIDSLTNEEIDQLHQRLLEAGGIDINEDDELSRLARQGLKDRNPERVLKHCKNLHVEVVNYGRIWDMVGLPTTGRKLLYCELKDCFLAGWSLDETLREFKETYCNKCDSCSPRPTDWRWTYRWQREREQPQKMKLILKKLREFG